MKNELIGYMYKGCTGDNDMATVTEAEEGVKVEYTKFEDRIFDSAREAVTCLHNEGYGSFFNWLEMQYMN